MSLSIKFWEKNCFGYINLLGDPENHPSPYSKIMTPALIKLVKKYSTKKDLVIDIGCGEGYLTRKLKPFRSFVCGCDLSSEMICSASSKSPDIDYWVDDIEKNIQTKRRYSLALSTLVFHYIENINSATKNVCQKLVSRGYFIVTIPHPCFYQQENFSWFQNDDNLPYQLGRYFNEGISIRNIANKFKTHHIHRTIGSYVRTFSNNGFNVLDIIEPKTNLDSNPTIKKANKVPFFSIFVLQKKD